MLISPVNSANLSTDLLAPSNISTDSKLLQSTRASALEKIRKASVTLITNIKKDHNRLADLPMDIKAKIEKRELHPITEKTKFSVKRVALIIASIALIIIGVALMILGAIYAIPMIDATLGLVMIPATLPGALLVSGGMALGDSLEESRIPQNQNKSFCIADNHLNLEDCLADCKAKLINLKEGATQNKLDLTDLILEVKKQRSLLLQDQLAYAGKWDINSLVKHTQQVSMLDIISVDLSNVIKQADENQVWAEQKI